mgnify:CR=1 FL=1
MEIDELISQIRQDVKAVRDQGQQVIDASALDNYLAELAKTASWTKEERQQAHQSQLEQFKATHASNLAQYAAQNQGALEILRSVIALGQGALRASMLINGGAAVATLGFLSNAWTKGVPPGILAGLPHSLLFFVLGVLAAGLATGFTFLAQEAFASEQRRLGQVMRSVVIALVIVSYLLFGVGSWQAYASFIGNG